MIHKFDVLILGGGAAGLLCAIEAGKRGRRVAILERSDRAGKKILISGGGRCNFTNLRTGPENFYSANPHFAKSALARYSPADFISLVEKHHIAYHEKHSGQLFCDRSAQDILTMLEAECRDAGVQIFLSCEIKKASRADSFIVIANSEEFHAPALVVATGGLSIPKLGASSLGYDVARQFGLKIRDTKPALVPFTLSAADRKAYCDLAGVSADVVVRADSQSFREKMLITHRGLSGPAILQISTYWEAGTPIHIDLAPDSKPTLAIRTGKERNMAIAYAALQTSLPKRLASRWLDLHGPAGWTNRDLDRLERDLHNWTILPAGTEGYEKAEVTGGGVDTDELSSRTMESRAVSGLYFIGEVVDVTGHLGGYNFQWAWASGAAAGRAV